MKIKLAKALLLSAAIVLVGCSSLSQRRENAYLAARSIPPLKIPPGLTSDQFHNLYPVSNRQYPAPARQVGLVPPGLYEVKQHPPRQNEH